MGVSGKLPYRRGGGLLRRLLLTVRVGEVEEEAAEDDP